jgi:hypothetical protein
MRGNNNFVAYNNDSNNMWQRLWAHEIIGNS